jgi:hypothetical protein
MVGVPVQNCVICQEGDKFHLVAGSGSYVLYRKETGEKEYNKHKDGRKGKAASGKEGVGRRPLICHVCFLFEFGDPVVFAAQLALSWRRRLFEVKKPSEAGHRHNTT